MVPHTAFLGASVDTKKSSAVLFLKLLLGNDTRKTFTRNLNAALRSRSAVRKVEQLQVS